MKERLKLLRYTLGIKQRELAERLGLNVSAVGAWETGVKPLPKMRAFQICKLYNIRVDWLLNGAGDMFEADAGEKQEATQEPKKAADALQEAAAALFTELSPIGQNAVLNALRNYIKSHSLGAESNADWPFSE